MAGGVIGGGIEGARFINVRNRFIAIEQNSSIETNPDGSLNPSSKTLNEFSDEFFPNYKFRDRTNLIYKKGFVENINPKYGAFTDPNLENGMYNIYFSESSFASKSHLYLDMGHEYVHVANMLTLGDKFVTRYSEYAAYKWDYKVSKNDYFLNKANSYYNPENLKTGFRYESIRIKYMKYYNWGLPPIIPKGIY